MKSQYQSFLDTRISLLRSKMQACVCDESRARIETGTRGWGHTIKRLYHRNNKHQANRLSPIATPLAERFWRTVKHEEVYLRAYSDGWEAEISLARSYGGICHVRPHISLGGKTPYEVYTETEPCSSHPRLPMSRA